MTDQEKKPTPRQKEALRCIFEGLNIRDRRYSAGRSYGYSSSMGGAIHRMFDSMGEAGWLESRESRVNGAIYYENKLTAAGLLALKLAWPNLAGVDAALFKARKAEAEARIKAKQEAAIEQGVRHAKAIARRGMRAAALREIMQRYQINLDALTDDQCVDIWLAIAERELDL